LVTTKVIFQHHLTSFSRSSCLFSFGWQGLPSLPCRLSLPPLVLCLWHLSVRPRHLSTCHLSPILMSPSPRCPIRSIVLSSLASLRGSFFSFFLVSSSQYCPHFRLLYYTILRFVGSRAPCPLRLLGLTSRLVVSFHPVSIPETPSHLNYDFSLLFFVSSSPSVFVYLPRNQRPKYLGWPLQCTALTACVYARISRMVGPPPASDPASHNLCVILKPFRIVPHSSIFNAVPIPHRRVSRPHVVPPRSSNLISPSPL
jgi:hypothetical protein